MKMLVLALMGWLFVSAPAFTAGVDGEWSITVYSSQGPIPALLKLKVEGEKLTGTILGEGSEMPLEGTVKDNEVSFSFWYGEIPVSMSGKVDGDSIKGYFDAGGQDGGEWSGTRAPKTAGV